MGQTKIVMKRALRGIYGGKHIQFGNQISEDGGNKTRRTWKPNRQKKRLFSLALDRYILLDVTTSALKSIDKAGGLDEYMLRIPQKDLHAPKLLFLKKWISQSYKKRGDAMLPVGLEGRVKKMIEWGLEQRQKSQEEEAKAEAEPTTKEPVLEWGAPEPEEDDYINEMFSKFNIGKQQTSRGGAGLRTRGRRPEPSSDSKPSPEEFPETLFSDVAS